MGHELRRFLVYVVLLIATAVAKEKFGFIILLSTLRERIPTVIFFLHWWLVNSIRPGKEGMRMGGGGWVGGSGGRGGMGGEGGN